MTPGVTAETVNGMSEEKLRRIIQALRDGSFAWSPTKRVYIPKRNGKQRPLGLPTWTNKLVQDVVRSVLEPYYEARFRDSSHGFRPGRGCHTVLQACQKQFKGAVWFIEGDILAKVLSKVFGFRQSRLGISQPQHLTPNY